MGSRVILQGMDARSPRRAVIPARLSFPRKRESTAKAIENGPHKNWIAAFAGMTGVSKGTRLAKKQKTWNEAMMSFGINRSPKKVAKN